MANLVPSMARFMEGQGSEIWLGQGFEDNRFVLRDPISPSFHCPICMNVLTAICKLPLGVRFFSCLFTFQTFRFSTENVNILSKPINVCHNLSKVSLKTPPNVDWLAQNVNVFWLKPERLKRKQT